MIPEEIVAWRMAEKDEVIKRLEKKIKELEDALAEMKKKLPPTMEERVAHWLGVIERRDKR